MMNNIPEEISTKITNLENQVDSMSLEMQAMDNEYDEIVKATSKYKSLSWAFGMISVFLAAFLIYGYAAGFPLDKSRRQAKAQETEITELNRRLTASGDSLALLKEQKSNTYFSPSGVVYRVQIGAFESFRLPLYSEEIIGLAAYQEGGLMKYAIGAYTSQAEAEALKTGLGKIGLKGTVVVAEYEGKKLSLQQAKDLGSY